MRRFRFTLGRVSALLVAAVAVLGASLVVASADGAKTAPRKSPNRLPYKLIYVFKGIYHAEGETTAAVGFTGTERGTADLEGFFSGSSRRFWLTRSGTGSRASYTILSSGDPRLFVPGVATEDGSGYYELEPPADSGYQPCSYDESYKLVGNTSASAFVSLVRNRLTVEIADVQGRFKKDSPFDCGYEKPYSWTQSPFGGAARVRTVHPSEVRFGQRFVLRVNADPVSDPTLQRNLGGIDEAWTEHFTLAFVPA